MLFNWPPQNLLVLMTLQVSVCLQSPAPNLQLLLEFSHGFNTFTLLLCCFMYYHYRSHPYSTFLKPRRYSETQFSEKHLLQQRQSFSEDIFACFSIAGDSACKQWMHKADRQRYNVIYTKKKKTDSMQLSLCSLACEVFIWITMQSIPQNQVKHRTFHFFPISVYYF